MAQHLYGANISRATLIVALTLLFVINGCVYTRKFTDAHGHVIPGSIATMEIVTIGGIPQSIWFRGVNTTNPALIILSGGPGASEAALFRHYNSALEQHFLVVYWEQRGAGRSYHSNILTKSMNIAQFLRDLDEVVELVKRHFDKDKVVLLAHSWGTVLGTIYSYRHPEKISAYVGIAQITDKRAQDRLSCQFALSEAYQRGNEQAVHELQTICPVPHSVDAELTLGDWVARFGGTFYGGLSKGDLIWAALSTDEANLIDLIKFGRGNRFSLETLWDEYSTVDLTHYQRFKVPIFFLLGRHDWHVPSVLAARYFSKIKAPYKQLVWFEKAGHNPPFAQPKKFNEIMIHGVLPRVTGRHHLALQSTCKPNKILQRTTLTAAELER
jgi:pimeloyl-ACP methyl ester carboxylesterase